MQKLLFFVMCSMLLSVAASAGEKMDESKMDEREKTRRRMLRAAGIDPDKKDAQKAKPAAAAPTSGAVPGVPTEYTFNVSGMM